jgi:leader peptidase (prepilin peptidase)/N-methyltransferase
LGAGDVKMMAMVGTFLGWRLTLLTVFLGSALGLMVGIFLMLFRRGNLQTKLPFGTLLGAASVIALFYGLRLIQWYVGSTPGNS